MSKGGIFKTLFIIFLIAFIIVYMSYPPVKSYLSYISVKERCSSLAKFANSYRSPEEIRELVIQKIEDEGFWTDYGMVDVYYKGEKVVISARFSDTLSWLNGRIIKPINYKVEVERLPVSIE